MDRFQSHNNMSAMASYMWKHINDKMLNSVDNSLTSQYRARGLDMKNFTVTNEISNSNSVTTTLDQVTDSATANCLKSRRYSLTSQVIVRSELKDSLAYETVGLQVTDCVNPGMFTYGTISIV